MDNDKALEELIDKAVVKEQELQKREEALALQNKEFAEMMVARKRQDEELQVLWSMVKDYMEENNIQHHSNEYVDLTLTPSGKYRLAEGATLDEVPDEVCVVKKAIDNKKVKAYFGLNNSLPRGVESTGNVLRKKFLL